MGAAVEIRPDDHKSHQPSHWLLDEFAGSRQPWLHLGAGATSERYEGSIELETAVFAHTDVVGDVARLPFADSSLGGVLALNVFEHLEDPGAAAEELFRVLEPGSPLLIQTAFIQPLHADPYHYYNATEKGVEHWFRRFDIDDISIPANFNPVFALSWCASELLLIADADGEKLLGDLRIGELAAIWRDSSQRTGDVWNAFMAMPADRQRVLAAGFQVRATRPANLASTRRPNVKEASMKLIERIKNVLPTAGASEGEVALRDDPGTPVISIADREHFFGEGFLVVPQLASADDVEVVNQAIDRVWDDESIYNPITISAYTNTSSYTETYIRNVGPDARLSDYKINHLYLYDNRVLDLLLSDKIQAVVSDLIGGTPLLFNGLNLERGSQQRFHFDTLYMPPRSADRMVVLWFALEDVREGSGELQYYPRSHLIRPFLFSHGGLSYVADEMGAFDRYMESQLAEGKLESQKFRCDKGDVFIWHSQLYHGGSAIEEESLTRKSMVAHYWRAEDMTPDECLEVRPGRYILDPRYMCVANNFTPMLEPTGL